MSQNYRGRRLVYVDSAKRKSGTNSNFYYEIKRGTLLKDLEWVSVLRAQIPKSYYVVQSNSNTFIKYEDGTPYTVSITPGRYNVTSFKTELQTQLNAVGGVTNFVVSFPDSSTGAQTGKFTFTFSGATVYFSFSSNRIGECIGWDKDSDSSSSTTTLTSANVINLGGETTLFIHSDLCSNNTHDNILTDVYASNANNYSNIIYENKSPMMDAKKIVDPHKDIFHFTLTDENDQELQLNGQNMLITLIFFSEQDLERSSKMSLALLGSIQNQLYNMNQQLLSLGQGKNNHAVIKKRKATDLENEKK